jgi:hypothetical protein
MKRNLTEELERIHTITYGKQVIEERGLLDRILKGVGLKKDDGEKVDDPKKADLVSDDVKKFFDTLQQAAEQGGISQQERGSMTFQKEVESMQIGLTLLGYELPKHGIDGLFGPETASAVSKFISDKLGNKENVNEATMSSPIGQTSVGSPFGPRWGRMHHGVDLSASSGTPIKSPLDGQVIDAEIRSNDCGGTIFIQHADGYKTRYCHCKQINVTKGQSINKGDVVGLTGGAAGDVGRGRSTGAHLHFEVYKDGKTVNPMEHLGSEVGEFVAGSGSGVTTKATPEMLNKLIELLKQKGVTSEDLKKLIDSVVTGGSAQFTDIDLTTEEGKRKYTEICQKFISSRSSNLLNITGDMLTRGAVKAFERHNRYVPPELALAQLTAEGGFSKDPNARPIRTKNPFNVGNTDSGANWFADSVQDGIDRYYDLIAKSYLGKGKTATDLVQNFVNKNNNRYASSENYERDVNTIALQANRIAQSVISV